MATLTLLTLAAIWVYPFLWMVSAALKDPIELFILLQRYFVEGIRLSGEVMTERRP